MTKLIELTVSEALKAVVVYLAEDAPTTKAEAKKLAKRMSPVMSELLEWAEELRDAIDEAANAIEQVAEADADERADEHATATENVDSAVMILERIGWERPDAGA